MALSSGSFLASVVVFLLILVVLQQAFLKHPEDILVPALKWMHRHPILGVAAYSVGFVIWFMMLIPCTPLELLAGYVYGWWAAVALLTVVKPVAHICTFLAARGLGFGEQGTELQNKSRTFKAIVAALKKPGQAWHIVFLVQLAAIPAGPKDCLLAMVPVVTLPVFIVCAIIAGIPFSIANAFLGSSASNFIKLIRGEDTGESPEAKRMRMCIMVGGGLALLACVTAIGIYTRRALEQLPDDTGKTEDEDNHTIGAEDPGGYTTLEMTD